jgi:hypothetical protein
MNTNPTPYALGCEDGEALWFFGMLVTMKATAEQTGGEFLLIEELAPRGRPCRFTSIRRTTSHSIF